MKRDLTIWLKRWKDEKERKPLICRGARQVGKTWLVNDFGENNFENHIEVNFEYRPEMKSCFSTLSPAEIIQKIELSMNVNIVPGKTLLFLDEIQVCPEAIKALRYFYEKMPELHVIAAGSLLEFVMETSQISMPVGRVQNVYLFPLSFGEYLTACGETKLRKWLQAFSLKDFIPEAVDKKAVKLLRTYFYTGGMPEAVASFLKTGKLVKIDIIHQSLLQNYKQDFGKYGNRINFGLLEKVFTKIPATVGNKFKYSAVDRDVNARDIRKALELLVKAHIIHRVNSSTGSGLPLVAHSNEKFFKLLFLDIGILQNAMGISSVTYMAENIAAFYKGLIAEQFVGQQLLVLERCYAEPKLHYWLREAKGSSAKIDYLWQKDDMILPVEVKAGKTGTLKSLRLFIKEKNSPFGIRFSLQGLSYADLVLSIPLYAVEALPGLVHQII